MNTMNPVNPVIVSKKGGRMDAGAGIITKENVARVTELSKKNYQ